MNTEGEAQATELPEHHQQAAHQLISAPAFGSPCRQNGWNGYCNKQARRLEIKPSIADLAQVHGRNAISWEEEFMYDVSYVDN